MCNEFRQCSMVSLGPAQQHLRCAYKFTEDANEMLQITPNLSQTNTKTQARAHITRDNAPEYLHDDTPCSVVSTGSAARWPHERMRAHF